MRPFHFKQFSIHHDRCAMKIGTDGVLLGAWADVRGDETILDIGAGSGLIAIMAAQRNPVARITGIEIDPLAAGQARENAAASPWSGRLDMRAVSLQEFGVNPPHLFSHIITNPPFFERGTDTTSRQRDVARQIHLLDFEDIVKYSASLLEETGKLSIILPVRESEHFMKKAELYHLYLRKRLNVRPKKDKEIKRILMEFTFLKRERPHESELIIQYEARNDWTQDYIQLTKQFYLRI